MDWKSIAKDMLNAAKKTAGTNWNKIVDVAHHEFEVLAQRFASIASAVASNQVTKGTAKLLYRSAKGQIVAVLAMLSTLITSITTKIVNAAIAVVKAAVNSAVGFALV